MTMLHGIVFFLHFKKNPPERVLNGLQPRGDGAREIRIISPCEGQKHLSEVNVLRRE
ncbi:hypothetical protein PANT111_40240 [Pantoea brenneri]|uniref:Uncharacterized protein n=1 Tax=Pantoea brenneri TaxID=472694 RepID=A0AAX3JAR8_9GAMM|nr:hypothetical protein PANT111_40240 [Pantoea brenneri]